MRGVILAAGRGTRLAPLTKTITKVMLPIYDKPMIYCSIEIMIKAGVKDVMIVVSNANKDMIKEQLGNGEEFGLNITYGIQDVADGAVGAFRVAKEFIRDEKCLLIFGDNVFLGEGIEDIVNVGKKNLEEGYSSILAYEVENPKAFGVVELGENDEILSIVEKPENPKSNYAALGLYFYDSTVGDKMDLVKKSPRGEYEITDINNMYMQEGKLKGIKINDGKMHWFDAGTKDSLLDASNMAKKLSDN